MLFRKISYRLALQFMGFVFLLFLANGALFFAADFGNARRMSQGWLQRSSSVIQHEAQMVLDGFEPTFPPPLRSRVRIVSASGETVYAGDLFANVPPPQEEGTSTITVQDEEYTVLTRPVMRQGQRTGYVQVAGIERLRSQELPFRAFMYLFVSAVVSALTFGVGLIFARRSLKPAEQMVERLEQFTQDASHELRTPITAVKSSIDLALMEKDNREHLLTAQKDLADISVLVERLLELARLDKFVLRTSEVDLSALVEEAIDKQVPIAKKQGVSIEKSLAKAIKVDGDSALLRQIIGNLLSNSIKFRKSKGGKVSVTLTADELSVKDNGIGIAEDAMAHIFNRFYQADTSRAKDGFGLGLALVKRIVELHGWTIEVKSEKGRGSTFTIHFAKR